MDDREVTVSRAFVKEQDGNFPDDDVTELPQSDEPNYVTPHGLQLLRERHAQLAAKQAQLTKSGQDDTVMKPELREIERELHFVAARLDRAIVVDPATQPQDEARFGAEVLVRDVDGKQHRFAIVGQDEADIAQGKISWASPLAKALSGSHVGDVVEWQRPAGASRLEVEQITYPTAPTAAGRASKRSIKR